MNVAELEVGGGGSRRGVETAKLCRIATVKLIGSLGPVKLTKESIVAAQVVVQPEGRLIPVEQVLGSPVTCQRSTRSPGMGGHAQMPPPPAWSKVSRSGNWPAGSCNRYRACSTPNKAANLLDIALVIPNIAVRAQVVTEVSETGTGELASVDVIAQRISRATRVGGSEVGIQQAGNGIGEGRDHRLPKL